MFTIQNILVPVDFSESSATVLDHAKAIADKFGAKISVLNVVPDPFTQPWAAEAYGISLPDLLQDMERDARGEMARLIKEAGLSGSHAQVLVRVGPPSREIVAAASENAADLVVMGTHGRGVVGHALLGSVAERVVRLALCPVLTVRHREGGTS